MKTILFFIITIVSFNGVFAQESDNQEWDDYFMPGIGYKAYAPKAQDSLGLYSGFSTEFVIYARARRGNVSYKSGPSRVKTYGNLSIMKSDKAGTKDIFSANLGLNLSFEAIAKRNFGIPYFGLELGGLFQRDFSSMQFTPVAGIQLVSNKRIIWTAQAGYNYTIKNFDELSGMQYSTTFNVLLWNE